MALWLMRAGRHREHEPAFFKDNAVYVTWSETKDDLHSGNDKKALRDLLTSIYRRHFIEQRERRTAV